MNQSEPNVETNNPDFQEWLKGALRDTVVTVTFTKKNGDERVMKCTLNGEHLPTIQKEATEVSEVRQTSNTSLSVYDVESNGWRSFRWDSIKQVEFSLDGE
jgi:hypothetical protein